MKILLFRRPTEKQICFSMGPLKIKTPEKLKNLLSRGPLKFVI